MCRWMGLSGGGVGVTSLAVVGHEKARSWVPTDLSEMAVVAADIPARCSMNPNR
jgi:hypothetical protein